VLRALQPGPPFSGYDLETPDRFPVVHAGNRSLDFGARGPLAADRVRRCGVPEYEPSASDSG